MKTSELSGIALDWAVAKCLGHTKFYNYGSYIRIPIQPTGLLTFCPSTDWELGGPIIEREQIDLAVSQNGEWLASTFPAAEKFGPTPLIAAMRCYVASKLGAEVEIPDELMEAV